MTVKSYVQNERSYSRTTTLTPTLEQCKIDSGDDSDEKDLSSRGQRAARRALASSPPPLQKNEEKPFLPTMVPLKGPPVEQFPANQQDQQAFMDLQVELTAAAQKKGFETASYTPQERQRSDNLYLKELGPSD